MPASTRGWHFLLKRVGEFFQCRSGAVRSSEIGPRRSSAAVGSHLALFQRRKDFFHHECLFLGIGLERGGSDEVFPALLGLRRTITFQGRHFPGGSSGLRQVASNFSSIPLSVPRE